MTESHEYSVTLERRDGFELEARFDHPDLPPLRLDEPEPLGRGRGPNPARLVGAAVGDCLSASLLFCLQKARVEVAALRTEVRGTLRRNEKGRLRLGPIEVEIVLDPEPGQEQRLGRCLGLFEDYCVVTASIRRGVEVSVTVADPNGKILYRGGDAETPQFLPPVDGDRSTEDSSVSARS